MRDNRRFQRAAVWAALGLFALLGGGGLLSGALHVGDAVASAPPEVMPETPVTPMQRANEPASNSPQLIADPNDTRFVVIANRLDAPRFGCSLQVSGDSGRGWITVQPVTELPAGADTCYAPEAAFDRDGILYYLFVGLSGLGNEPMGVFLTTSADRARTFGPPQRVLGERNFGVRMAINPDLGGRGRLNLVWLHSSSDPPLGGFAPSPNPILAAFSDDGGRTFSEPVQVSDPDRKRVVAPALTLGPGHSVYVAYYDLKGDAVDYQGLEGPVWQDTWAVILASSSDGGRTFGLGQVVDDSIVPAERVMLVFTMSPPSLIAGSGRYCVAWTDARYGDADALIRCFVQREGRWSGIRRLNDDPRDNGRRQYLPRLAMASSGRLDAIFYDRRDDPLNVLNHVMYTFSTDGGASFSRNYRLTSTNFDSRIGQRYTNVSAEGQIEFGGRIALLSSDSGALAAWTDTRNSRLVQGTVAQDIFSTKIVVARSAGQPLLVSVLGGTLILCGMAAFWRSYRGLAGAPNSVARWG